MERAIIDSIKDIDYISDIEEIKKSIDLIPYLDETKIIKYLKVINQKLLYKKTGYFLELFKDKFNFTDIFFEELLKLGGNVRGNFSNLDKRSLEFNNKWKIYTYKVKI